VAKRRLGTHLFALAFVAGVALMTPAFARPTDELRMVSLAAAPLTTDQVATAPVAPDGAQVSVAANASPTPTSMVLDPRLGLPTWLRTQHDAPLWSAADTAATTSQTLPTGSYLKPLGAYTDARVEVYFPGSDALAATQAWVDTSAVLASGVPTWIAPPADAQPAPPDRVGDSPAPDTTALHVAIVDDASGQLMYAEDPYAEVPQASTTKIATTIVALERAPDLSRQVNVSVSASAMYAHDQSSTMGLEPGMTVTLDTLLHGMMLPSGNDAAEQVALALGDSREQYVDWMNQEAAALGLKDTHFVNPSGMDAAGHYSSAYDMVMLARYAMRNATFRELARTRTWTVDGFGTMYNLNRFLGLYPGADGVKIGETDAAGKTIVASAVRDGHRVYVGLMHSQDLPGDCSRLFNWVWDNFAW
jgi:D-alanyl-D-alanine carboxypeptidase